LRLPNSRGSSCWLYTSLLHADRSPLGFGGRARQTEALLRGSGVPFVLLRNGW
jgi:NAD(P)H dehydrogenase (quinone)